MQGYNDGFNLGFEKGQESVGALAPQPEVEAPAQSSTKKKNNKKRRVWKEWADTNQQESPLFRCPINKKEVKPYPQEIEEKLRSLMERIDNHNDISQDLEYACADDWVYTLRLFDAKEKVQWEDQLAKYNLDDYVGAQWDAQRAEDHNPPAMFSEDITDRPIFIRK